MKKKADRGVYHGNPDHTYFSKHFEELVQAHGGKWIVLSNGQLIAICEKTEIEQYITLARKTFPHTIPFVSPIPRIEEIECLL